MAYKFPWTNYHELNLDWILDTVKELFTKTEQNNAIVEQYDGRLTEVELTADNAQTAAEQAQQNSTAALDLAQNVAQTATQAQQAAGQAQQAAGQAQQAAGQALEAAATAQQTATQAQQTAQNFDGRITQAENNAANALQAAQAFDEQVQGAITAANNANEAATLALTTATETSRELAAQRSTLEGIVSDGVTSLQDAAQDATEEIEAAGQSVLDSIPADYTALSELVDKKADVIYNTAAGDIASFNDGADDMKIKSLIVNIEPAQAGSGDPSPDNVRPISGHTGMNLVRTGKNLFFTDNSVSGYLNSEGTLVSASDWMVSDYIPIKGGFDYYCHTGSSAGNIPRSIIYNANKEMIAEVRTGNRLISVPDSGCYIRVSYRTTDVDIQLELGSAETDYEEYRGNQISVTFPSEAGTVYGGTLTLNPDRTGELVVDRAEHTVSSNDTPSVYQSGQNANRVGILLPDSQLSPTVNDRLKIRSNIAKASIDILTASKQKVGDCCMYSGGTSTYSMAIFGVPLSAETAQDAKAWLIEQGCKFVYYLAEPVTYPLTESEISGILSTLYGQNNIWSDTGDTTVEYPADTKTYIDNKFAELQALILEH